MASWFQPISISRLPACWEIWGFIPPDSRFTCVEVKDPQTGRRCRILIHT